MPLYKFKVADPSGRVSEILVEGDNQAGATRRVQARNLIPIDFLGQSDSAGGGSAGGNWGFGKRFNVLAFTDRLVPLLNAEIPLERALHIVEETAESPQEREVTASFRRGLHEGRRFSQLIRDRGRMFPRMYASIVEAGEESGALPKVLGQLHAYLKMTEEMKAFVISSSIYPMFVVIVCVAVVSILLAWVVPKFGGIIASTGRDPTWSTEMLLAASNTFRGYWWLLPLGLALALTFVAAAQRDGKIRDWCDEMILKLPLLNQLVIYSNIGRLIRTMAILMRSGVHILDTVTISARVLTNQVLRNSISGLAAELRRGEKLSSALARNHYIPTLVVRMLAVGEETGAPHEMLERVADRYDNDLRTTVKRALAWFEPLTILILGGVVGAIVVVLFMTIIDMQKGF